MIKSYVADIYFLKEEEGGRKKNISNQDMSFRPILYYNSLAYHCQIDFGRITDICLGTTHKVILRVEDSCPITNGSEFDLRELKNIGKGIILDCLD